MDLRANTAVDVLIGPFLDITDSNITEDSLTLTAAEIKLSKNGQALTLKSDVTSAVFDDDGYYNCELDVTDTNTEGQLVLIVHQAANALPVRHEYNVLSEAAFDSLYATKDAGFMDVNIKTIGRADTQETEANNLEGALSGANVIDAAGDWNTVVPDAAGVAPTAAEIETEIWDALQSAHTDADSMGAIATELALIPTILTSGTATAGTAEDVTDTNRTEAATNYWKGALLRMTSGNAVGQVRQIVQYAFSTDTFTVQPDFTSIIEVGDTYQILSAGATDVVMWANTIVQPPAVPGIPKVDIAYIVGNTTDVSALATNVAAALADTNELRRSQMQGSILTIESGSSATVLVVTAEAGLLAVNLDNAAVITNTIGRVKSFARVTNVTGTAPDLTLDITPALPETPQVGDTFIVGPLYLDTAAL